MNWRLNISLKVRLKTTTFKCRSPQRTQRIPTYTSFTGHKYRIAARSNAIFMIREACTVCYSNDTHASHYTTYFYSKFSRVGYWLMENTRFRIVVGEMGFQSHSSHSCALCTYSIHYFKVTLHRSMIDLRWSAVFRHRPEWNVSSKLITCAHAVDLILSDIGSRNGLTTYGCPQTDPKWASVSSCFSYPYSPVFLFS